MLEEGRGLDPQWRTTQSLSKRCRPPDRLTFRGWRMAEHSKLMPCGTIGVQSRAGALPDHHPSWEQVWTF